MVSHSTIRIRTRGKGTLEITDEVARAIAHSGVREGIVAVFVRHTSASLVIAVRVSDGTTVASGQIDLPDHALGQGIQGAKWLTALDFPK